MITSYLKKKHHLFWEVFKSSWLLIAARIINTTNSFFTMLLIAHLGPQELAAGALLTGSITPLMTIAWTFIFSVGVYVGRVFGEGDSKKIGLIVRSGWIAATILGTFIIVALLFLPRILQGLHQPPELLRIISPYFVVFSLGVIPSLLFNCNQQFLLGVGCIKMVLLWSLYSLVTLCVLGFSLVFSRYYSTRTGIVSIAWIVSTMYWLVCVSQMAFIYFKREFYPFEIFTCSFNSFVSVFSRLLQIGWGVSLQVGLEWITYGIGIIFMGFINNTALASLQIIIQINLLLIMIPVGISHVGGIMVSQLIGREDYRKAKEVSLASMMIGIGFGTIIAIIYVVFPDELISLYLDIKKPQNLEIIKLTRALFIIAAISQWIDVIRTISIGLLRGYHDTQLRTWVGLVLSALTSIPIAYFLGFFLNYGAYGVRIGFLCSVLIGTIFSLYRLKHHKLGASLHTLEAID